MPLVLTRRLSFVSDRKQQRLLGHRHLRPRGTEGDHTAQSLLEGGSVCWSFDIHGTGNVEQKMSEVDAYGGGQAIGLHAAGFWHVGIVEQNSEAVSFGAERLPG